MITFAVSVRAQLEESGIITRRRARIVVRDPGRLAALARGEPMEPHGSVT